MNPSSADPGLTLAARPPAVRRGDAFGLAVEAAFPIPGLAGGGDAARGRAVRLETLSSRALGGLWPRRGATRISDRRGAGGRRVASIDAHPDAGYLVSAGGHGRFRLSLDGAAVDCAPVPGAAWRWQRYLIGQVLPFAAVLQGLEGFHASAVAVDGRGVAFIGSSGAGKTTLACHLALRDAAFLTDDVAVFEARGRELCVHPGMGVASLRHDQAARLDDGERARLGRIVGRDAEAVRVVLARATAPAVLDRVYFIRPSGGRGGRPIEPVRNVDPRLLLASSFNFVIRTPERLANHLDVCARLASSATLWWLDVPPDADPRELAARVEEHVLA
jgi:hypothetical protein